MTNMLLQKRAEYIPVSREAVFVEGLPDPSQLQSYNHIISTHLPFHWLPKEHVETGGKIIYVIRNPKDVVVSLYKFLDSCGVIPSNETFEEFVASSYLGEREFLIIIFLSVTEIWKKPIRLFNHLWYFSFQRSKDYTLRLSIKSIKCNIVFIRCDLRWMVRLQQRIPESIGGSRKSTHCLAIWEAEKSKRKDWIKIHLCEER